LSSVKPEVEVGWAARGLAMGGSGRGRRVGRGRGRVSSQQRTRGSAVSVNSRAAAPAAVQEMEADKLEMGAMLEEVLQVIGHLA
jgi:hypothetical protein